MKITILGECKEKDKLISKLPSYDEWEIKVITDLNTESLAQKATNSDIIIISDQIPNSDPLEVNKLVKKTPKVRKIPTILYNSTKIKTQALSNGFNGIISSHMSASKIRDKIIRIISKDIQFSLLVSYIPKFFSMNFAQKLTSFNYTIINYNDFKNLKVEIQNGLKTDALLLEVGANQPYSIEEINTLSENYNIPVISLFNNNLEWEQIKSLQSFSIGIFRYYKEIEKNISTFIAQYLGLYKQYDQILKKKWLNNFLEVTAKDSEFEELFYNYLKEVINPINELEARIAKGEREGIQETSHKLKGNTQNYQSHELALPAEKIYKISSNKKDFDLKKITRAFIKLKSRYWGIRRYGH